MRRMAAFSLIAILLCGCGGGKVSATVDELQQKNDDLTHRVKTLEDDLLAEQKKSIQREQALQDMNERLKAMETRVDKLLFAATTVPR